MLLLSSMLSLLLSSMLSLLLSLLSMLLLSMLFVANVEVVNVVVGIDTIIMAVFQRKLILSIPDSVTRKKLPNVYQSCPKMIPLEKLKIL